MTATEIVARWQHLNAGLMDSTWSQSDELLVKLLREFWQAAKLGAQAEAENVQLRAIIHDRKRWRNIAGAHSRNYYDATEVVT